MNNGIFLLLGTNLGDRSANLEQARQQIALRAGLILKTSSVYVTAPWGITHQPDFYNQVIVLESSFSPQALLATLLDIEQHLGRIRKEKWGARTIDIDILFYGDAIIDEPHLQIPHPAIAQRRFTLVPLAELSPDLVHPLLGKSISALLDACTDHTHVKKLT